MRLTIRFLDGARSRIEQRTLDAPSEQAARLQIVDAGGLILSVSGAQGHPPHESAVRATHMPGQETAILCRELRSLTGAGMSVVEALDALAAGAGSRASIYYRLLDRLNEGRSLSAAMRDVGGLPPLLIASVQASERTSALADAFDAYIHYEALIGHLRRKILSAAVYPAIVVGTGGLVGIFLLTAVIPRFATLYAEMGGDVSWTTKWLLRLSVAIRDHSSVVIAACVLAVTLVAVGFRRGGWRRAALLLAQGTPFLRRELQHFTHARLFEALALLAKGGYSLHEALTIAADLDRSPAYLNQLEAARRAIERGATVSRAFAAAGLADPVTERLMRAGERGGDFDRVLKAIAERHATAFETFVERLTRIVEPILLLAVALIVGSIVVALYLPIFDIAASVQ